LPPLKQPAFFKNFTIEPGGYALVWNAEIDISEYELWKNGTVITDETEKALQKIESYAQKADNEKFDDILARVPDIPPIKEDELLEQSQRIKASRLSAIIIAIADKE